MPCNIFVKKLVGWSKRDRVVTKGDIIVLESINGGSKFFMVVPVYMSGKALLAVNLTGQDSFLSCPMETGMTYEQWFKKADMDDLFKFVRVIPEDRTNLVIEEW